MALLARRGRGAMPMAKLDLSSVAWGVVLLTLLSEPRNVPSDGSVPHHGAEEWLEPDAG